MILFTNWKQSRAERSDTLSLLALVSAAMIASTAPSNAAAAEKLPGDPAPLTATDFRLLDEVRLGLASHNLSSKENGEVDISLAFLTSPLPVSTGNALADFVFAPRLEVGGSLNSGGDTSFLYAGLTWDVDITESLFLEATLGGAVNNGKDATPGRIDMGCRVTFREAANLGYRFNEHWQMLVGVEHLSHAGLCDGGNDGLTNAGVRVGYRF